MLPSDGRAARPPGEGSQKKCQAAHRSGRARAQKIARRPQHVLEKKCRSLPAASRCGPGARSAAGAAAAGAGGAQPAHASSAQHAAPPPREGEGAGSRSSPWPPPPPPPTPGSSFTHPNPPFPPQKRSPYCRKRSHLPALLSRTTSARSAPTRTPTPQDDPRPTRRKYSVGLPRTSLEEPRSVPVS